MTEKEFEKKLRDIWLRSPEGAWGREAALALAKEAGATFDPEPVPVEIWRSESDANHRRRLMFKPDCSEANEPSGLLFEGWRAASGGVYRWESSEGGDSPWAWCGNDPLMAELARRLLAEWGMKQAPKGDDWIGVRCFWKERDLGAIEDAGLAAWLKRREP